MTEPYKFAGLGRISQQAIIFNDKAEVLAMQFSGYSGTLVANKWTLPGGTMKEDDKTTHHGLKREVSEETGMNVNVIHPITADFFTNFDGTKRVQILYLCEADNHDVTMSSEHKSHKWIPVEQAAGVDWINEHYPAALKKAHSLWRSKDD